MCFPQIDLSINLIEAYLDENNNYSHDTLRGNPFEGIFWYRDDSTNYMYTIMATLCEIAFQKGGMDLVREMVIEAKDEEGLYDVIEKYIGIKRKDINDFIREHLNTYY